MENNPQPMITDQGTDNTVDYGFGDELINTIPAEGQPTMVERPEDYREYATTGEKLSQIPIGVAEGAIKSAPSTMGLGTGLSLGMLAAPYTGPLAPVTVLLGGSIGLYAGLQAEDATTALMDKFDLFPDPERSDVVPYREGAKTSGSSIPFMYGARFLPEAVDNWTSRLISSLGKGARETPKLFLASESVGMVGTGVAGGISEATYPGDPLARFGFEFVGGTFFPFRTVLNNVGEAKNIFQSGKELFGVGKAEARAVKRLQEIFNDPYVLETFKEDPEKLIKALRSPEINGIKAVPTAAQKTGSAVLSAFEASLAKQNAQFGGDVEAKGRAYMQAHKELVSLLTKSQDPEALLQAAKFQSDYFRDLINMRLKVAQGKISLKGLTPDTPEYRAAVGQQLQTAMAEALADMRKFERSLYEKAKAAGYRELTDADLTRLGIPKKDWAATKAKMVAPKQEKANSLIYKTLELLEDRGMSYGEDVLSTYVLGKLEKLGLDEDMISTYNGGTLSRQFQNKEGLPPEILEDINKKIGLINPNELQNFRSYLLDMARKAAAGKEKGDAQVYGELANAALKDLEAFDIPEYKEALSFSRVLNDHFSRAFPAEINASKRSGADKIAPEILVDGFFQTVNRANDRAAIRMLELEDAADLAAWSKVVDDPSKAAATRQEWATAIRDGDTETVRRLKPLADQVRQTSYVLSVDDAFKKIFEQDINGLFKQVSMPQGQMGGTRLQFDTDKYQKFIQQNDAVLKRFHPALYQDLQNVNKAENYFRSLLDRTSALNQGLSDKSAFAAVLNSPENVTRVVSTALNSGNPVTQMQRLMDLVTNKKVIQKTGLGNAPKRGLASSLYDWAFLKASPGETGDAARQTDVFDPKAFKAAMFGEIKPGMPSLSEMMVKNGLADVAEMKRLADIVDVIERTQKSMGSRQFVQTLNTINPLEDLAIRMAGTNAASLVAPKGPGSIIAAGAGVRTFKKLFEDTPLGKTREILEKAAKDPQFMADLLSRGKAYDQRSFFNIGKRVLQSMQRNGLIPLGVATSNYFRGNEPPPTDEEIEQQIIGPTTGMSAASMLKQVKTAPPTRGLPFISQAQAAAPAQGPQPTTQGPGPAAPMPPGQPQGSSRQMLQSLFPFDTTLQLPQ